MLNNKLAILHQAIADFKEGRDSINLVALSKARKMHIDALHYARFFYPILLEKNSKKTMTEHFNSFELAFLDYLIEEKNYSRTDAFNVLRILSVRDILAEQNEKEIEQEITELMLLASRNKRIRKSRNQHPSNDFDFSI